MASNHSEMSTTFEGSDTLGDTTELAHLDAQVAALAAQHAELLKLSLLKWAAIAPWKKVPNEVLQRIFRLIKQTGTPTRFPFDRTEAPMQLTQVCSRWRAVAHDTAAIWQDLECSVYLPPDRYEREATTAFIKTWIARAAYMPLSIFAGPVDFGPDAVKSTGRSDSFYSTIFPPIFGGTMRSPFHFHTDERKRFEPWLLMADKFNFVKDIIIPNSTKIRELRITFPRYYRHTAALLQQNVDFHLLEDLVLNLPRKALSEPGPAPTHTYTLFQNAPLRKLKMMSFQMSSTQFLINWAHLTHFEVGMIEFSTFMEIFGQMTSLQTCKVFLKASPLITFNPPGANVNPINPPGNLHPFPNLNPNPPALVNPGNIVANPNLVNPPPNLPNPMNAAAIANPTNAPMNMNANPPNPAANFNPVNAIANPNPINAAANPNPVNAVANHNPINPVGHFNPFNMPPNLNAFQIHLNQPPTFRSFPPISIPSLHTLDLMASIGGSFPNLPEMDFPALKHLALEAPEPGILNLLTSILRTTISLSEFRAMILGFSRQSQPLATLLNTAALSQITRLSLGMPPAREVEPDVLVAIGEGRLLPQLETFEFEGLVSPETLLTLLIPKGFIEGLTIHREADQSLSGLDTAEGVGNLNVPFRKVTIRQCDATVMENPGLRKIQELVGKDRFVMEMAEMEQWAMVNQIEWDVDE